MRGSRAKVFGIALLAIAVASWIFVGRSKYVDPSLKLQVTHEPKQAAQIPPTRNAGPVIGNRRPAGEPPDAAAAAEDYLNRQSPGWHASRNAAGTATTFTGGLIPGVGRDAERAYLFGRGLAEAMGIPPEQISEDQRGSAESSRAVAYHFPQRIDGYDVYGAEMTILARKSDGGVYTVNPGIVAVSLPLPDATLSSDDARAILSSRYATRQSEIELSPTTPLIWASDSPHELAWKFSVVLRGPMDHLAVLIGATSARILLERSVMVR